RLPLRQLLTEPLCDLCGDVVFGARRAVAADPRLAGLACLGLLDDPALVDHGVELVAHLAGLRLALDLVAVHDPAALRVRAGGVPPGDGSRRLFLGLVDDLERADAALTPRSAGKVWNQAHSRALGVQAPVGGERDQAGAVGAGDGAGPEVRRINLIGC